MQQDILDYLFQLSDACVYEKDYSEIWDTFWEGVSKLHDLGFVVEYYDPDRSCKSDIIAWLEAASRKIKTKNSKVSGLLLNKPWENS